MFKVQISGRWMENQDLKELQTEMFAILLYVAETNMIKIIPMSDALSGVKSIKIFYEVNEEKEIFIEGSGLNKQLRNINGLNNYVLTVNCENYQILT